MNHVTSINFTPKKTHMIDEHKHTQWEFVCYISGEGTLYIDGEPHPFKAGDIICQPPFIPHYEVSEAGFQNIFLTVESYDVAKEVMHRFEDNETKDVYTILSMIYRTYHLKKIHWEGLIQELLDVFKIFIQTSVDMDYKNLYVTQLETSLVANISNCEFDLRAQMNLYPVSIDHLRRLFKSNNMMTPRDYLLSKRMVQAKNLLENNYADMQSIKYIASMVGYEDPYYFSKVFKSYTGVSPSQWRRTVIGQG